MKITILTNTFYPEPIGIAPLMTELAEDLIRRGHEVLVATVFPHYPHWTIDPKYRGRLWAREDWRGVKLLRTWMKVSKKATVASKMTYYATFTATASLGSFWWGRQDLVLVVSPPLSLSFTGWLFRLLRGGRTVLLVCDLLPDTAIALEMIKNPLLIRSLHAFERWSYRRANHIIVVSNAFRENLLRKGVSAKKISVIHTWVDTEFMRPLPKENAFRTTNKLENKFVVLYAGNIGMSQGLETMLEAAHLLRQQEGIRFLIVGDGTKKAEIQQKGERMNLRNVLFLPLQPREEIPLMYSAADVSLVLQRKNVLDINLPGKIQTIMSSGRPLVAATHPAGEPAKIIRDANCGLLVPPEDAKELARAIDKLYQEPETRRRLGDAGRAYALEHFSRESAIQAYVEIFGEVTKSSNQRATGGAGRGS